MKAPPSRTRYMQRWRQKSLPHCPNANSLLRPMAKLTQQITATSKRLKMKPGPLSQVHRGSELELIGCAKANNLNVVVTPGEGRLQSAECRNVRRYAVSAIEFIVEVLRSE